MRYCHKAMMLDLSGMASLRRKLLAIVLPMLLLGCSSTSYTPPRPELVISGWRDPAALAPGADFETYVREVSQELRKHRLPFVASMADAELGKVAPFKQLPDRGCKTDAPRGIAILIHGLSDTAFAMRDLAATFSKQCFEARVLLLPGHGTRPADLMAVDHRDWLSHVGAALKQARSDSSFVVLAWRSASANRRGAVAQRCGCGHRPFACLSNPLEFSGEAGPMDRRLPSLAGPASARGFCALRRDADEGYCLHYGRAGYPGGADT
jgi:hypothetical protein